MNILYRLKTDEIYDEEGVIHTVYGIEALDCKKRIVASVADIFFDKCKASDFINMCNSYKLSLLHLNDMIEEVIE